MRLLIVLVLFGAAAAAAACDQATSPVIAGLGGTNAAAGTNGNGTPTSLAITPNRAQLAVGTTLQLATNAPAAQRSQVQWNSLQTSIATVSPSGLVTALAPGTAVIVARFASDTTRSATATIDVFGSGTGTTGGTTGGSGGTTGGGNPGAP